MDRYKGLSLAGLALVVLGLVMGFGIPARYHGISCGPAWRPTQFGSELVQTSVTIGCDGAVVLMSVLALLVIVIGAGAIVVAVLMDNRARRQT